MFLNVLLVVIAVELAVLIMLLFGAALTLSKIEEQVREFIYRQR